ncbi:MAG: M42 family metallopeptidase [Candidatus Sumerlaeia bacterium]|nr:M42 family metallopeptidase [Candidatus Sumerlaeia bacterium]
MSHLSDSIDFALEKTVALCAIPSPTGYTEQARQWLDSEFRALGFPTESTRRGALRVDLGGDGHPLVIASHIDTLGAMVRAVTPQGRLRVTNIGGLAYTAIDTENCTVHTRDGRTYSGVVQMPEASAHVFRETNKKERTDETLLVFLDEKVASPADVEVLGIRPGDFVCFDPRTRLTASGFLKSRHIDDKACVGLLLALAREIAAGRVRPARKTWALFTAWEEVGHGAAHGAPREIEDFLVLDMGCVGDDLQGSEFKVSICAKDGSGPFDYSLTSRLVALAQREQLDFAVDIFPFYTSDAAVALRAAYDVRHGLIGPGVFASHGYERTHRDALANTYRLLAAYVQDPAPEPRP